VFKDGLLEMTKGSKVIRYTTPNSINKSASIKGYEYCRLFTKDRPYYSFNELQKTDGLTRMSGKDSYSVLDNTYNLNIAPMGSVNNLGSSNIDISGKVKKYMLSIENLAWRTSSRPGYRVDDLPACEVGPNGGRIMWFPPYDLTFSDDTTAQWDGVRFLGRTEPLYVYKNTERKGSLSFKIVVDHPSIMNVIVNKELEKETNSETTKIIDSFFAGCLKYDPIDLLKKYRQFSLSDIFETTTALRTIRELEQVQKELPGKPIGETTTNEGQDLPNANETTNETNQVIDELKKESQKGGRFEEVILLFDQSLPRDENGLDAGSKSNADYQTLYNTFINNEQTYKNKVKNIVDYPDGYYLKFQEAKNDYKGANLKKYKTFEEVRAVDNTVTLETLGSNYIIFRENELNNLFVDIKQEKSDFDDLLKKIASALDSDAEVEFTITSSANANGNVQSNDLLSERRYDSVLQTILKAPTANGTLKTYYDSKKLKINSVNEGKNSTLKTVINSGVLNDFVYNDLVNETPLKMCKTICGKY
jgi:outer membrane protein OmpA-like peptidoglycan-associated protein